MGKYQFHKGTKMAPWAFFSSRMRAGSSDQSIWARQVSSCFFEVHGIGHQRNGSVPPFDCLQVQRGELGEAPRPELCWGQARLLVTELARVSRHLGWCKCFVTSATKSIPHKVQMSKCEKLIFRFGALRDVVEKCCTGSQRAPDEKHPHNCERSNQNEPPIRTRTARTSMDGMSGIHREITEIRVLCFIKSAIPCSLATRVNSHVNPKLMRNIRVWQWRWMNSKSRTFWRSLVALWRSAWRCERRKTSRAFSRANSL